MAASSSDSPSSSLPLGRVQSSYFGRWTRRTSRSPFSTRRHTTPPAARTTSLNGERGSAVEKYSVVENYSAVEKYSAEPLSQVLLRRLGPCLRPFLLQP